MGHPLSITSSMGLPFRSVAVFSSIFAGATGPIRSFGSRRRRRRRQGSAWSPAPRDDGLAFLRCGLIQHRGLGGGVSQPRSHFGGPCRSGKESACRAGGRHHLNPLRTHSVDQDHSASNSVLSTTVLKRPSCPLNVVMSACSKLALLSPRSSAAFVAAATAVGVRSTPCTV